MTQESYHSDLTSVEKGVILLATEGPFVGITKRMLELYPEAVPSEPFKQLHHTQIDEDLAVILFRPSEGLDWLDHAEFHAEFHAECHAEFHAQGDDPLLKPYRVTLLDKSVHLHYVKSVRTKVRKYTWKGVPTRVCIKGTNLREKKLAGSVKEWLSNPRHIYTGRDIDHPRFKLKGSVYGNPFHARTDDERKYAVKAYRERVLPELLKKGLISERLLGGRCLGCYCPDGSPCHNDVLIEAYKDHVEKVQPRKRPMGLITDPALYCDEPSSKKKRK